MRELISMQSINFKGRAKSKNPSPRRSFFPVCKRRARAALDHGGTQLLAITLALEWLDNEQHGGTGGINASASIISARSGISKRQVQRLLPLLEEAGIARIISGRNAADANTPNRFNFIEPLRQGDATPSDQQTQPLTPDRRNPLRQEGGSLLAVTKENKEQLTPLIPQGGMGEGEGLKGFELFWNAYPAHRRSGRGKAEKLWRQVSALRPPIDELLAALRWFRESSEWNRDQGRAVPGITRFLEEQRWEVAPKAKIIKPPPPAIDEDDAFRWRCEVYPESEEIHPTWHTFPFAKWPDFTKKEYRDAKNAS